jgi:DNA polymerase
MASDDMNRMESIAAEINRCEACDLHIGARRGVPGAGDLQAEVMMIGEAPSSYDDRTGRPFSGPTGDFLDELLDLAGMRREQVYLTNVVMHRLPANRDLSPLEVAACAPFLNREIAAVNPILIVTLGRYALAHFLPKARITAIHGKAWPQGKRLMLAMYNPAAALHREELRSSVIADFATALPAALVEARSRTGGVRPIPDEDNPGPQQLSLF